MKFNLLFHRRVQTERTDEGDDRRARLAALMPVLRAFVRRMTGSAEFAQEVMQETCLRVLGAAEIPADGSRFSAWCREVARNVRIAQRRRSVLRSNEVSLERARHQTPDTGFDPEQRVYASERLWRASAGLDGESAHLLVRRYMYGERVVDLAGEHHQKANALRTRLWRLRSTLRTNKRR